MGNFGTLNSFVNTSEWLKLPGNNRLKSWVKGWTKPRCILDSWDSPNRNIGGNLKPVIHLPPWSAYFERLLVWEPPTLYPWYILVQELTGKLLTLLANGDRHWHPGYASRGQKMQRIEMFQRPQPVLIVYEMGGYEPIWLGTIIMQPDVPEAEAAYPVQSGAFRQHSCNCCTSVVGHWGQRQCGVQPLQRSCAVSVLWQLKCLWFEAYSTSFSWLVDTDND